jgi:hypothetical protein
VNADVLLAPEAKFAISAQVRWFPTGGDLTPRAVASNAPEFSGHFPSSATDAEPDTIMRLRHAKFRDDRGVIPV